MQKIKTFIQLKLFNFLVKKLGRKLFYQKYCGIPELNNPDCKHEQVKTAVIKTNKGDVIISYCKNCGGVLSVSIMFDHVDLEFANAILKANKLEQKLLNSAVKQTIEDK